MALDQYRLKLKKIKTGNTDAMPGYSLSFKTGASAPGKAGYEIISALAGNNDIIMELNTDLFWGESGGCMEQAAAFESAVKARNLQYASREMQSDRRLKFLGMPIEGRKKSKALEIAAYVPNSVWNEESFHSVLPGYGGRYYITDRPMDAGAIVNGIYNIPEEEKNRMFRMIVFYIAGFGQMGIIAGLAGEDELKGLLGLK